MPRKPSRWKDRSHAGGAVLRRCGDYTIRMSYRQHVPTSKHWVNGGYYCQIALGRKNLGTIVVGAPAYLSEAVDSPEAFDSTASACMAFAADEEERGEKDWGGIERHVGWGSDDYDIKRGGDA